MKIVVTGATGFIGRSLCNELVRGHDVVALTRRAGKLSHLFDTGVDVLRWNPESMDGWEEGVDGSDVVVNLAGTNLASRRWTKAFKAEILESRVNSSRMLLGAAEKAQRKPKTVVLASAIGFYGFRGDEELDEGSERGHGFLAEVCSENERVSREFEALGIRAVVLRTGVVLGMGGGGLQKMTMPFGLHLGSYWGDGRQWMSWISLVDEVGAIRFLIENDGLDGVFNLTAPEPERNRRFFEIIGDTLKRRCWLRIPAFCLKMMFGEMADELFLTSQRVYPRRLLAGGFEFEYAGLKDALESM